MKEFIDETSVENGTPINRANMMAVQGFIGKEIVFNDDGSIVETNSNGEILTVTFGEDGSITETFSGQKIITKTTSFINNKIVEVMS